MKARDILNGYNASGSDIDRIRLAAIQQEQRAQARANRVIAMPSFDHRLDADIARENERLDAMQRHNEIIDNRAAEIMTPATSKQSDIESAAERVATCIEYSAEGQDLNTAVAKLFVAAQEDESLKQALEESGVHEIVNQAVLVSAEDDIFSY